MRRRYLYEYLQDIAESRDRLIWAFMDALAPEIDKLTRAVEWLNRWLEARKRKEQ